MLTESERECSSTSLAIVLSRGETTMTDGQWSLQAQVRWKELTAPLVISQTIHLPHYTFQS